MSKLWASTRFWAFSMARLIRECSMGCPSSMPRRLMTAGDPLGTEDPQQIVLQGEVETGGSRVPLASGAAPQLVVDAPGFVALRAQDVEPPGFDDLLVLLGGQGPHLLQDLLPAGRIGSRIDLLPSGLLPGQPLRVPAQHDVRSPAGHVGGDRHGPCTGRPGR